MSSTDDAYLLRLQEREANAAYQGVMDRVNGKRAAMPQAEQAASTEPVEPMPVLSDEEREVLRTGRNPYGFLAWHERAQDEPTFPPPEQADVAATIAPLPDVSALTQWGAGEAMTAYSSAHRNAEVPYAKLGGKESGINAEQSGPTITYNPDEIVPGSLRFADVMRHEAEHVGAVLIEKTLKTEFPDFYELEGLNSPEEVRNRASEVAYYEQMLEAAVKQGAPKAEREALADTLTTYRAHLRQGAEDLLELPKMANFVKRDGTVAKLQSVEQVIDAANRVNKRANELAKVELAKKAGERKKK